MRGVSRAGSGLASRRTGTAGQSRNCRQWLGKAWRGRTRLRGLSFPPTRLFLSPAIRIMPTESQIQEALANVIDPNTGQGLVAAKAVKNLRV